MSNKKHHEPNVLVAKDEAVLPEVVEEIIDAPAEEPGDQPAEVQDVPVDGPGVEEPARVDFIPMPKPAEAPAPEASVPAVEGRPEVHLDASGRVIKPYPTLIQDLKAIDWGHDVRLAKLALSNTAAIAGGRVVAGTKAVGRGLKSTEMKIFMGIFTLCFATFMATVQVISYAPPVTPNRIVCEASGGLYLGSEELCIRKDALIDLR